MVIEKNRKGLRFLYKCLKILVYSFWVIFLVLYLVSGVVQNKYPLKHKEQVLKCCKSYELESALVFSVIKVESDFNEKAVSKKGAVGLMQIKPETAKYIANMMEVKEYDLYDASTNIDFGCYYLRYLLNKFEVLDTALCAYNAGEGNVSTWLKKEKYSEDKKTLKKVPFKETEKYVKKTNKAVIKYKKLYGNILDK